MEKLYKEVIEMLVNEVNSANHELDGYFNGCVEEVNTLLEKLGIEDKLVQTEE